MHAAFEQLLLFGDEVIPLDLVRRTQRAVETGRRERVEMVTNQAESFLVCLGVVFSHGRFADPR